MRHVKTFQPIKPEGRVQSEGYAAEPRIGSGPAGGERAVHGIVSNDEEADVEPAKRNNEERSDGKSGAMQALEEKAIDVEAQPSRDDRNSKHRPQPCLAVHG